MISRTIYGLRLTVGFLAKIGVFEKNFNVVYTFPLGENCLLTHRMIYFAFVLRKVFWKKNFYYPFCMENYIELWGSCRVTDHGLLRGSCAGQEGFLLYAKEIKSWFLGFVCSRMCTKSTSSGCWYGFSEREISNFCKQPILI